MIWLIWGVMLLLQNASFTLVSRARNSSSILYHAGAAVLSNGVYFANLFVGVDLISKSIHSGSMGFKIAIVGFYTVFTVIGSVSMHHFLMKTVEKKRKIA
jgi:hypothetical protein